MHYTIYAQRITECQILQQTLNLSIPHCCPYCPFLTSWPCIHFRTFYWHSPRMEMCFSTCSIEKVQQKRTLVTLLYPDHFLGDILWCGTNTAHSQEDILLKEVTGQYLQTNLFSKLNKKYIFKKYYYSVYKDMRKCEKTNCTWISLGKVALNIMVWRAPLGGMVSCSTIRLICGSKPMSSIRSASSRTR